VSPSYRSALWGFCLGAAHRSIAITTVPPLCSAAISRRCGHPASGLCWRPARHGSAGQTRQSPARNPGRCRAPKGNNGCPVAARAGVQAAGESHTARSSRPDVDATVYLPHSWMTSAVPLWAKNRVTVERRPTRQALRWGDAPVRKRSEPGYADH
jgi:hypothetical protein